MTEKKEFIRLSYIKISPKELSREMFEHILIINPQLFFVNSLKKGSKNVYEHFKMACEGTNTHYLITFHKGEPVGYIRFETPDKRNRNAQTRETHVREGFKRKGVSEKMLKHLVGYMAFKFGAAVYRNSQNTPMKKLGIKMQENRRMHYGRDKRKEYPDSTNESFDWHSGNKDLKIIHRKLRK